MLGAGGNPMGTSQRVSRGFHRLAVHLRRCKAANDPSYCAEQLRLKLLLGRCLDMRTASAAALVVIISSIPAVADPLRCEIAQKFGCSPAGCTTAGKLGSFAIIDMEAGKYSKCDAEGCDEYSVNFSRSGVYVNVNFPGHATVAKLSIDGSQFFEVATLMNNVIVSFGACTKP